MVSEAARTRAVLMAGCVMLSVSCAAASRLGTAQITHVDGTPCFGIPDEQETRAAPVRLFSLHVSETSSTDWRTLPEEAWGFAIEPPGSSIVLQPGRCIRYGELPASAKRRRPPHELQPYRVYVVEINARPAISSTPTQGYKAEFCVKPGAGGKQVVQAVPWDRANQRWQYEVCAKP